MTHTITKVYKAVLVVTMISLTGGNALAQVKVKGNVFGGGNQADVQTNTVVNISAGSVEGNVYGGGNLGDVGTIVKNTTDYNYKWTNETNPGDTYEYNNTGVCNVTITGGEIGTDGTSSDDHGNVYGAGKGVETLNTFWCEKGMVYKTSVEISKGTVYGDVFGGGEVGRVENDTEVSIDGASENDTDIKGNVFGAGKGLETHGYSALVRGDTKVTIKGYAKVEKSVYGGGEIASVGRFKVENDVPTKPLNGGGCTVAVQGNAVVTGDVFGAGKGVTPAYDATNSKHMTPTGLISFANADAYLAFLKTLALASTPSVTIDGSAQVNGSVYGGGQRGITLGSVAVYINGGTVANDVYGGGALADTNTGNWNADYGEVVGLTVGTSVVTGYYTKTVSGTTTTYTEITSANAVAAENTTYYSKDTWAHVTEKSAWHTTTVSLTGGTVKGDAYGGGLGEAETPAYVYGDVAVIFNGTKMVTGYTTGDNPVVNAGRVFGCNNVKGSPKGHVKVWVQKTAEVTEPAQTIDVAAVFGGGNQASYEPQDDTEKTDVEINRLVTTDRLIVGSVFGGGNEAGIEADTEVKVISGDVKTAVYGGCNTSGTVSGDTQVNVTGGTIGEGSITKDTNGKITAFSRSTTKGNVHGGGYGKDTYVKGSVEVNIGTAITVSSTTTYSGTAEIYGDVYGGGALGHVNAYLDGTTLTYSSDKTTTVNLNKGTIYGDAYGGGLGNATYAAYVGGTVNVNQNEVAYIIDYENTTDVDPTDPDPTHPTKFIQVVKSGRIFGCNNLNGYPLENVTVTVNKTVAGNKTRTPLATRTEEYGKKLLNDPDYNSEYELAAVYGGGNLASFTATDKKTIVLIKGCDDTSIETVYGGGNAAAVPETDVKIQSAYELGTVFGGGNGKDKYYNGTTWVANPGANVSGDANTVLYGGVTHEAYGGSNKKGTISGNISIDLSETHLNGDNCDLVVGKFVGAGKDADANGVKMIVGCKPGKKVPLVYFGADNANINGDVEVTITSGNYGKVFAGNNEGGAILGKIILNIEETGNCETPITIEELYLGGNEAPYSIYGYYKDTNDGKLYPIGKDGKDENGTARKPVRWNSTEEKYVEISGTGDDTFTPYANPILNVISCTRIDNIFGGGFGAGAAMYADPTVNINMIPGSFAGNATVGVPAVMDEMGLALADNPNKLGIIGNVYGGGNAAAVIGNTTVNVGNLEYVEMASFDKMDVRGYYTRLENEGSYTYTEVTGSIAVPAAANTSYYKKVVGAYIAGNVFGAGKGKDDNVQTALVRGNTNVNMGGGTVKGNIYGGGELSSVGDFTYNSGKVTACADNTGKAKVTISGGTIGDESEYVYNANSTIEHTNGGNVFAGGKGSLYQTGSTTAVIVNWPEFAKVKETELNISGGTIMSNAYGGAEIGSVGYENGSTIVGATDINITGGTIGTEVKDGTATKYTFGSVFGGGYGSTVEELTDANNNKTNPKLIAGIVYGKTDIDISEPSGKTTRVWASVYGGGEVASVKGKAGATEFATNIRINGGKIGKDKLDDNKYVNGTQFGGASMGNVYGGGKGYKDIVRAGQIKGNTKVTINGGTIYHNVYGGGAYSTVGDFTYGYTTSTDSSSPYYNIPKVSSVDGLATENTGKAEVYITGGTIGVDGIENGMVFGSSRGDVGEQRDLCLAWVYDTKVVIGSTSSTSNDYPAIKGSVYGSGENGHVYTDTDVKIYSGTIGIHRDNDSYNATRGNVYGGGCGEDTYPANTAVAGMAGKFEPSAGIVYGTANVTMTGGQVLHNIYGAGALGSVGKTNGSGVISDGGSTIIAISGGIVGYDGYDNGNVFGAARGNATSTQEGIAQVKTTSVTVSGTTTGTIIRGNVYGGGQMGNVQATTAVDIQGGAIKKNVIGGGMGDASTYKCAKAMVGIEDEGANQNPGTDANKDKGTHVTISNGTVGTLNEGTLVEGTGNVYGGGEIARVEWNTQVTIGPETGSGTPYVYGDVFGAGKGLETHGYSALVRGNSTVIVQGSAKVGKNVYGGGEKATVGRYWVKDINNKENGQVIEAAKPVPENLPSGMPYKQQSGGICRVTIQGSAEIGYNGADDDAGHVFGAGQGVEPSFVAGTTERMVNNNTGGSLVAFTDEINETTQEVVKTAEQLYLEFLETLALVTNSYVTVNGGTIKGNVYGGSESGFVQHDTDVQILGGTIGTTTYGDVFGGGKGLPAFAEAGKVKGNAKVAISGDNTKVNGNVYGGGELGDVGTINKTDIDNYTWSGYGDTDPNNDTGICTVFVTGGTVQKNVFGAGKGSGITFQCEKAMAYKTEVSVSNGTVIGNIYGGGEVGRVENDTQVTVGRKTTETEGNGTGKPDIKGSVFGAGKGLATYGYSALVRGNTAVTVEGASGAKVGVNVYGGGEIASVGRYGLNAQKMPNILLDGGRCIVKVLGNVVIGPENASDDKGNVFGAGKGVSDPLDKDNTDKSKRSRRMTVYTNSTDFPEGSNAWEYYNENVTPKLVWEYFQDNDKYNTYLETLALATHPEVTIAGSATINSSVFGGGELGLTKGSVIVNINGGTIVKDVYGGGSLANTNTTHDVGVPDNVNGGWKKENGEYVTTPVYPTTTVNLQGGIMRHAYGGGLGRVGANPIEAKVYGKVTVKLNEGKSTDDTGAKVDRVFGANNLNGSPQKDVTVYVYATQNKAKAKIGDKNTKHAKFDLEEDGATTTTYDVLAVYGGGNEAAYIPETAYTAETPTGSKTQVLIEGCQETSIKTVYGGGNAASVPESNVTILSAYEIERVFGGGNGKDDTSYGTNPGADIGVYKNASNEDVRYGTGNANTATQGGYIHELYGASNEKGTIKGNIILDTEELDHDACPLKFDRIYNAGKNADVEGDMIAVLGCQPEEKVPEYYGGAENANVKGNVELTITNGTFGQIFAGNNKGGAIFGHIKLNVEETGCSQIIIDELYGCGNNAAYSVYGYYHASEDNDDQVYSDETQATPLYKKQDETDGLYYLYWDDKFERPFYRPRTSADDTRAAVSFNGLPHTAIDETTKQYEDPEINIISATRIGKVFGGGLGSGAVVYGSPTVNINQIYGTPDSGAATTLGSIGVDANGSSDDCGVYGGGNAADVIGNTTVNIGTETSVQNHISYDKETGEYTMSASQPVLGANILSNVYGGGNLANVTGNTFVNVCAVKSGDSYAAVAEGTAKVNIAGNVYGGGKGIADNFLCDKAMVGTDGAGVNADFSDNTSYKDGNTSVIIGNGTINGNVYGGGQIGRVEKNTMVTIGIGSGDANKTSAPIIRGDVFGGGKGDKEHGYAALVRGNPTVIVQGDAKVGHSVYGAGEIASVARYKVAKDEAEAAANGVSKGMPYALANPTSGYCTVKVQGNAEIGPDGMQMTKAGGPDDAGHVFAAGKGFLPENYPYDKEEDGHMPKRRINDNGIDKWEWFHNREDYIKFIQTQALASNTELTIDGNAFVKGSVYGGSENGLVQYDTKVYIKGGQIGCGKNTTERYPDAVWGDNYTVTGDLECASWEYKAPYAPYDPYAQYKKEADGKYYYDAGYSKSAEGGAVIATDGHTYYGNVFGGGSGSVPYFDTTEGRSKYLNSAGTVKGNTTVEISGGHILTSVYGGCEATNVLGKATVKMTDGTIGVPRTLSQIIAHPVTCYLFGGGKGDQRIFFNKDTNVEDADVQISGGRIYGSVYGGGEDGHVLRDVTMTIGKDDHTGPTIGTLGTSYVDGNVFGGGRGFGGDAYTAGNVAGSVNMTINGGHMLGSVYGGGRLASVGYGLYLSTEAGYGEMRESTKKDDGTDGTSFFTNGRGHVDITISGGTIGNDLEYKYNPSDADRAKMPYTEFDTDGRLKHTKGGNVFAGGMGRLYQLDGTTPISSIDWWRMGNVKQTKLTITGGTIKSCVYGGGELGAVNPFTSGETVQGGTTEILIQNANNTIIGTEVKDGENTKYTFGSVYGGGYGSTVEKLFATDDPDTDYDNPKFVAGLVHSNTKVVMQGGKVLASVYGGGETASVNGSTDVAVSGGSVGKDKVGTTLFGGATMGNVYGGGSGHRNIVRCGRILKNTKVTISGADTKIYHNVYGGGAYGTVGDFVYDTRVDEATQSTKVFGVSSLKTAGTGKAEVIITGGTIGVDGHENGMVFGSSRGDVNKPGERDDHTAWVYDTFVTIGTQGSETGPAIKGSVYGSGENGHTFHDTDVKVHSGTIGIAEDAEYPYRGNVYGGGCGTDKYYSTGTELFDGNGDTYNPLAGIVYGNTTVTMDGGTVVHNIYGAGAMGSVGKTTTNTDNHLVISSGGTTTIEISGGTVGVDGTADDGNVFGAARGDETTTQTDCALVKTTGVTISGSAKIKGNVYGGGALGDVGTYYTVTAEGNDKGTNVYLGESGACVVNVTGGTIGSEGNTTTGNVFGAGRGDASTYTCQKAMVKEASVTISNGTIYGDVYGGGEIGRVEKDAEVKIGNGTGEGSFAPVIMGNVYGAGAGLETHGYSALVRGNSKVTIEGNAKVRKNVYGGGKAATVGKYWVSKFSPDPTEAPPTGFPDGMPYKTRDGGLCTVTIQGNAIIGPESGDASETEGQVFGAGKGVNPRTYTFTGDEKPSRMNDGGMEPLNSQEAYFQFLETLALASNTKVTIGGNAVVKASVFGGSESGFVQDHTDVTINDNVVIGTATTDTYGNVFAGGKGLETFAEAGRVRGNTKVAFNGGTAYGSVYGGGKLGDVGTIDKTDINNYIWSGYGDGDTDTSNDTGVCSVSVTGGTVHKNVFGAGKGSGVTFQCEKAMAYNTEVTISDGTVNGNIYGGGEVGRVENDTKVTIGRKTGETEGNGTGTPDIKGSVFGAGKGLATHGYSALVRGNTAVTVEGASGAKVGANVYGGGEIASVGRYGLNAQKMPNILLGGGRCIVKVLGDVVIGPENASDEKGNVFGAGKGVDTPYDNINKPQRMTLDGSGKSVYETIAEDAYATYLETLALVTHPEVTIDGHATVNGSVFGGGELGLTKGSVVVNINNGTIEKDVYGGGALANTNTTHEVGVEENGKWKMENGEYVTTTVHPTTTVNLIGGLIKGDAYGGGLGQLEAGTKGQAGYVAPIEAMVYGDVSVTLGTLGTTSAPATATAFNISYLTDNSVEGKSLQVVNSGRVFGCNNLNGSPKGNVTVTVNKTVAGNVTRTPEDPNNTGRPPMSDNADPNRSYEVAAVYGGGNLADYVAEGTGKKTNVIINTCDVSIEEVYGGGNAAEVPETNVLVNGAYEIEHVFGGGNGRDKFTLDGGTTWNVNPGADIYGNTNTFITGGYVHEAYGASNEKGTITGSVTIDTGTGGDCLVVVDKLVAAGKNADVNGDLIVILGCKDETLIPIVYGGADNANVNGNVELTITSGRFGQVFGGNNLGGAIRGHIILNIEETSDCEPIRIDELYLGGNMASYSKFGYYIKTTTSEGENATGKGAPDETADLVNGRLVFMPRKSKDDPHYPVDTYDRETNTWTVITDKSQYPEYDDPVMNLISCTEAKEVFGGGYGVGGDMYADPTVNINMIPGRHAATELGDAHKLGVIGDVYGGGNEADVVGDATVNIGTAEKVLVKSMNYDETTNTYTAREATVEGANITGTVYGGGNLANVGIYDVDKDIVEATGNTYVNIGAVQDATDATKYVAVAEGISKVVVAGNVFGGGKGSNATFKCEKAMVTGGTNINIGNGTVNGTVYGGGEVGRVENDTKVTIGLEQAEGETTSAPVIEEYVFGAGKGDNTHGYSALVRGDTYVTIQGNAKIGLSVYGGGEIASVGRYKVAQTEAEAAEQGVEVGMPYSTNQGGVCTVIVQGNAEIGPDNMKMVTDAGWPTDRGHVYGAGKGVLPYEGVGTEGPRRMIPDGTWESYVEKDDEYLKYIETLALTTTTDVTISGNAFVKGSVYGGSENGHVQKNTHVTIDGDCQIGNGDGVNRRYTATEWASESLAECASWPYKAPYAPYDVYDYQEGTTKPKSASDGHTYYGNVFGGGSGIFPYSRDPDYNEARKALGYSDGLWLRSAGMVYGSAVVDIKGGHILTSVYGGNECTDVIGTTTVNMSGGTIGVPRTVEQIKAHPVTCYLFGAGKGDQRINFNTWTNVEKAIVNITGGRIFGSVFGGGEDGHVLGDVEMTISGENTLIGTTGTSYVDGNIFGGGRGFSGEAQTAGTVGGNIGLSISGGKILGSVYGGGRLASVGTEFTAAESPNYGNLKEDGGNVTIDISGGIIGNEVGNAESGNVFGASMGRLTLLDGSINPIWPKMAQVKNTTVTVSGGTIKRTVFGGGELGTVRDNATVNITGGTIGRDVYGAGYGSDDFTTKTMITVKEPKEGVTNPSSASDYNDVSYVFTPMIFAGCVGQNTYVNVSGGYVKKSVYGGGEMASAGIIDCRVKKDNSATNPIYTDGTDKYVYISNHKHDNQDNDFVLSWPYHFENVPGYFGATHVEVTGGRIGLKGGETNPFEDLDNGDVVGGSKGIAGDFNDYVFCANVGSTEVTIDYPYTADPASYDSKGSGVECITGAVYGGAENGHVMGDTKVTLKKGLIGHSVYGGGSGKGKFSTKLLKIGAPANSTKESDYYTREIYSITAGKVFGNTEIIMEDGYVVRNVYGGGNMGSVGKGNYAGGPDDYSTAGYGEKVSGGNNLWTNDNPYSQAFLSSGKSKVTILGGTVGYINPANPSESVYGGLPYGNIFGGCRGEAAPNIRETPRYLYSPEFFVGYVNETDVTIGTVGQAGPKISGSVYGGGMDGHVRRDTKVTINSGEIGSVNGGLDNGNVYGAGSGIGKYKYDFDYDGKYTSTVKYHDKDTKEEDYSTSAGSVTRFTTVDINGGTIHRTVYGGGSLSSVGAPKIGQDYDPYHPEDSEHSGEVGKLSLNKVTISGGQIGDAEGIAADYGGDVIGGSRGESAFENSLMSPSSFASSVWTDVTIKDDANVLGNVFGGGEAGMVKHDTDVKMQGGTIGNDLYGGGDMADVGGNTTVTLTGGTVNYDVFGGARGRLPQGDDPGAEANVGGDVLVTLNGTQTTDAESGTVSFNDNCVVNGSIFGCNNVNGTPMGHSTVHIFKTAPSTNGTDYDLAAVYGGGKQSDYVPADTDEKQSTEVIIEGCDLTSIENVYGGGYGAATPGTNVLIKGTKIIDNVYGGGFGADDPEKSYINPGANVGYHTDGVKYESGDGRAVVQLMAGNVNHVYGGSNTKGDIFAGSFVTNVANDGGPGCCDELKVEEIYGGGKSADMYGGAEIVLGCMPDDWIGAIYAGAENADVGNDISLTLTSGKFGRVFGGNNMGGKIDGSIEVNIEENPECDTPLVIGELYGGGNQASYETPARYFTQNYPNYQSPRVNVRAFTSIGNIYGGGYGANATVTGNPMVNINEVAGGREYAGETITLEDGTKVTLYERKADGKMGVIGTVFGGGNAAKVIGNTTVNVGTTAEEQMVSLQTTDEKGNVVIVKKPVVGADIRGNVYGGGNAAEVTGKTNVIIGKDGTVVTPTPSTSPVEP